MRDGVVERVAEPVARRRAHRSAAGGAGRAGQAVGEVPCGVLRAGRVAGPGGADHPLDLLGRRRSQHVSDVPPGLPGRLGGAADGRRPPLGVLSVGAGTAEVGHRLSDGPADGRGERLLLRQRRQGPGGPVCGRPVHRRSCQRGHQRKGRQDHRRRQGQPAAPAKRPRQRQGPRIEPPGGPAGVGQQEGRKARLAPAGRRSTRLSLHHLQGGGETVVQTGGPVGGAGGLVQAHPDHQAHHECEEEADRQQRGRRRRMGQDRRQEAGQGNSQARDDQGRHRRDDGPRQAGLGGADGEQSPTDAPQAGDERVHVASRGVRARPGKTGCGTGRCTVLYERGGTLDVRRCPACVLHPVRHQACPVRARRVGACPHRSRGTPAAVHRTFARWLRRVSAQSVCWTTEPRSPAYARGWGGSVQASWTNSTPAKRQKRRRSSVRSP